MKIDKFEAAWEIMCEGHWDWDVSGVESKRPSQETLVIRKDLREKLSAESRYVLSVLLNSPSEIASAIPTPRLPLSLSFRKLKAFLMGRGWSAKWVEKVREELKGYVKEAY